MDVLGFGESSIDYVHVVAALPRPGTSKLRITSHHTSSGGQVATAMAACAALGLQAGYAGPVGNDENGDRIREALRRGGVDLSALIVREAPTRFAVILVDDAGDRTVLWSRDPRLNVDPRQLSARLVHGVRVVHVDGVDERASIELARLGRATGATVTCDIDTITDRTADLLAAVTTPILAEHVPHALTGEGDVETALRMLRRTHDGVLVVTLGERGAAALEGGRFVQAPAVPVEAIDTTAAGDVFRAGFIYSLLQPWTMERSLAFANAAAAVACTRRGALSSVPSLEEVERMLVDSRL